MIETDNAGEAFTPQVAFDANGNAIAVWYQSDGVRLNIWANRFNIASGSWGTAELIETDSGSAVSPQIAMDASGNAIAVWFQGGVQNDIWANRYSAASGTWGTAQLIETGSGNAALPVIAMDAGGNAIAVWVQHDGTRYGIWANRYSATTGTWDTAQLIETGNGDASRPQIAVDTAGNAIAVWHQHDGARDNIRANRYSAPSGTWGAAQSIETSDGDAFDPQIVMDNGGNAIAVWRQLDGAGYDIRANRFNAASGTWGTAELIETDNGTAASPRISMDVSGHAVAVWRQFDGTRRNIWVNRYIPGSGWGTAQLIETSDGDAFDPQIVVDNGGNAIAVWRQSNGTRFCIWANRFDAASGTWGTAQLIETGNGDAFSPQVAMNASGNAIAVWYQSDSARLSIWANRFQ